MSAQDKGLRGWRAFEHRFTKGGRSLSSEESPGPSRTNEGLTACMWTVGGHRIEHAKPSAWKHWSPHGLCGIEWFSAGELLRLSVGVLWAVLWKKSCCQNILQILESLADFFVLQVVKCHPRVRVYRDDPCGGAERKGCKWRCWGLWLPW